MHKEPDLSLPTHLKKTPTRPRKFRKHGDAVVTQKVQQQLLIEGRLLSEWNGERRGGRKYSGACLRLQISTMASGAIARMSLPIKKRPISIAGRVW